MTKDQYDGAGRVTEGFSTDGASGTNWTNGGSVTGDNVLAQTELMRHRVPEQMRVKANTDQGSVADLGLYRGEAPQG